MYYASVNPPRGRRDPERAGTGPGPVSVPVPVGQGRASRWHRRLRRGIALALLGLLGAPALGAEAPEAAPQVAGSDPTSAPRGEGDDPTYIETPAFPGVRYRDALRLNFQTLFLPEAKLGSGHTSLYRPELRGRVTVPLSQRAVVRLALLGGMARYEFRGDSALSAGGTSLTGASLHLYQTRAALEGALRLNPKGETLFTEDEIWSLLGGIEGSSDFQSGAFSNGLRGGGSLALGYQRDGWLRVSAGVAIRSSLENGGVDVGPVASFRWDINEVLTLRNHALGLRLEYHPVPALELFVDGRRSSEQYRLDGVAGLPDDLTFRDRQVLAGAGFEWRLTRRLRINGEVGAVAWRKLRIRSDDLGTLASQRAESSPYFQVRFEVRP